MADPPRPDDDPLVDSVRREQGAEPQDRADDDADRPRPAGSPRLAAVRRALSPRGGRRAG